MDVGGVGVISCGRFVVSSDMRSQLHSFTISFEINVNANRNKRKYIMSAFSHAHFRVCTHPAREAAGNVSSSWPVVAGKTY